MQKGSYAESKRGKASMANVTPDAVFGKLHYLVPVQSSNCSCRHANSVRAVENQSEHSKRLLHNAFASFPLRKERLRFCVLLS